MNLRKFRKLFFVIAAVPALVLFQNCTTPNVPAPATPCTSVLCNASKYSLLVADQDGANLAIVRTSTYQEMTHPRMANDKNWIAYTAYNDLDTSNCASLSKGYFNTEIRAIQLSGAGDKRVISPTAGEFNSNSYWVGTTNEFTYLSGPVTALKFFRATVNSSMSVTSGPTQIPIASTIVPMDPATHAGTGKIVYPGLYNPGSGYVKSIFIMDLSNSANVVGLSLGRNRAGTALVCADAACENIMENDPKVSPDGTKVAFMRKASSSGVNGFGWHLFVVPVASPLAEVDISYSHIGSNILLNDVLPEWIDNDTLLFSTIDIASATSVAKNVYTMKSDGSQRTQITLPSGFKYGDVFPFTDGTGKRRMIIAAEKIGAVCTP